MAKKLNLSAYKRSASRKTDADRDTKRKDVIPAKYAKKKEASSVRSPSTKRTNIKSKGNTERRIIKPKQQVVKSASLHTSSIRLNRYIAHCGVCSRREADELIADGRIRVNKDIVTEMGFKVMPGDKVFNGKKLLKREDYAYVLLNKPKDFITTTKDTHERKTVMDLVKKAADVRLYPVGRLDRNTTGLLLLTNDGELADRLSHPSNNIRKIYKVELDKPLLKEHFQEISNGFTLEDGPIAIDEIAMLTADNMSAGVELHSGKNRVVRRIFEHFEYKVERLDRVVYAGLTKVNLPRGKWRHLTDKEIGLLRKKGKKRN